MDTDGIFIALAVDRWMHFACLFGLLGSTAFWFYQAASRAGLAATGEVCGRLIRILGPLAVLSGCGWLALSIANMTGDPLDAVRPAFLHIFFFATPFGPSAAVRLVLLLLLFVASFAPLARTATFATIAALASLLLVSQAWLGHAAEGGRYAIIMVLSYAMHVLAGAVWIGGLPLLLVALFEQQRHRVAGGRDMSLPILLRYSAVGMIAVTLIVASGVANIAFHATWDASLLSTPYGQVLATKLALVAVMLVLAYLNRFVLMPVSGAEIAVASRRFTRLPASIGVELILGLAVLAAAAVLGITPPPQ